MRVRCAVLISGGGSNMLALAEAARKADYPAEIALVLSNNPAAGGIAKAQALGIPTATVDHRAFGKDRAAFETAVQHVLDDREIAFVALAGFMRVLTESFVERWRGRMINIHPSLLPKFRGLDTHARALAAGEAEHGCTVHWVEPELDAGGIILQARVPVLQGDTPQTLATRVLAKEHSIYPAALATAVGSSFRYPTDPD